MEGRRQSPFVFLESDATSASVGYVVLVLRGFVCWPDMQTKRERKQRCSGNWESNLAVRFFFCINFPGEVLLSLLFCVLIFDVRLSEAQENNGAPMAFFFACRLW